ncbi:proteasome accessory factor PafA2 family protein, partial [Escherichia coli]|nr:proteasome accessory factor PafA2 family protein [Escherichia coli]
LYVDHAHPEYSSPETATPREAVLWDRAGELIARRGIELLRENGREFAIYKNNVDGKGAAYGSHENYLVDRALPFTEIIRYLT